MPTQYRRTTNNPLYSGHFIPLLGYWTEAEGYVKKQSLQYQNDVLACPIIAVVDEKFGNKDITFGITGKQAQYDREEEEVQGDNVLKRKAYIDAGTTIEAELNIPRFTRSYATFLLTGLGNNIWDIESISINTSNIVGRFLFTL